MKKTIIAFLAGLGISVSSQAVELKVNNLSNPNEGDFYIGKSVYLLGEPYYGIDLSYSNKDKTVHFEIGGYVSPEKTLSNGDNIIKENKLILFPRLNYKILNLCFANCNSNITKIEFNYKIGTGIKLGFRELTEYHKLKGGLETLVSDVDSIPISTYTLSGALVLDSEVEIRIGFVEGKYQIDTNGKSLNHLFSIGLTY